MKKKDFIVWCGKKNKKRGRPSKAELLLSEYLTKWFKDNESTLNDVCEEMILYGTGIISVDKNGKLKHERANGLYTKINAS